MPINLTKFTKYIDINSVIQYGLYLDIIYNHYLSFKIYFCLVASSFCGPMYKLIKCTVQRQQSFGHVQVDYCG